MQEAAAFARTAPVSLGPELPGEASKLRTATNHHAYCNNIKSVRLLTDMQIVLQLHLNGHCIAGTTCT